jgi:hypothetical protein
MEKIERRDGVIYYGSKKCSSADEAYLLFRSSYHESIGRTAYLRLNRLGSRKERVHGFGFVFDEPRRSQEDVRRVPMYLLGIVAGAYCRMLDGRYIPDGTDKDIESWFDRVFEKGSGLTYLIGLRQKTGRTSKRLKTRFR